MRTFSLFIASLLIVVWGCGQKKVTEKSPEKLPYMGNPAFVSEEIGGTLRPDTIFPKIPPFRFLNQDSNWVTEETFSGKIYVADFFFTSCPTICPVMKAQLLRVYEAFRDEPRLLLLSHTIDPEYDSVSVLRDYASRLGVSSEKWHFVTGDKDSIYAIAEHYMVSVEQDPSAPGGYMHSGAIALIDSRKHIRGYYDGTVPAEVDRLIQEIPILLREESSH